MHTVDNPTNFNDVWQFLHAVFLCCPSSTYPVAAWSNFIGEESSFHPSVEWQSTHFHCIVPWGDPCENSDETTINWTMINVNFICLEPQSKIVFQNSLVESSEQFPHYDLLPYTVFGFISTGRPNKSFNYCRFYCWDDTLIQDSFLFYYVHPNDIRLYSWRLKKYRE